MTTATDRIEQQVILDAPLPRVWRAISDSAEFGTWFGLETADTFAPGAKIRARIAVTKVDPEVAELQKPHVGTPFEIDVERVEPERLLSFRWHPGASGADASDEPTTLVTFAIRPEAGRTVLTITESGFDLLPEARREAARVANAGGWRHQAELIVKYLALG